MDRGWKIFNRDIRLSKGAKFYQWENEVSHYPVYAGTKTTAWWAAAQITLKDNGTSNVTILQASITAANTLTVTFSADPWTDTVIYYTIFRASA